MRTRGLIRSMLALAAVAVIGCDGGDPVSPEGPRLLGASSGVCYVGQSGVTLLDTGLELTLLFHAEREIGPEGGFFGIGASRMEVPAGAVAGPTTFMMDITIGRHILAEFKAIDASGQEVMSFAAPVRVEIGYHKLEGIDPAQLVLVWLVDGTVDGIREEVATTVDLERRRIIADLDHFSIYAVGIN